MDEATRARMAQEYSGMCDGLASGELIKDMLKARGLTRDDLRAYWATVPGAKAVWDIAREASADAFMDEAMDEARADVDKELAQHVRTRIDTLKWAARIRNPRLYGDKAQLDVNVRTVDLTAIIRDANARLAAVNHGRIIEGTSSKPGELPALARTQPDAITDSLIPVDLASLL